MAISLPLSICFQRESMKQALQFKYKTFINFKSFAASSDSLKFETLAFVKATSIGFKGLLSNSAAPMSSIGSDKKDKKVKRSMGSSHDSEKGSVKEISVKSKVVKIQSIRDDMGKLEAMTVEELRATLRSNGVPAKGCKRDLVSTLKCFVEEINGKSSIVADKEVSSVSVENIQVKKKAKNLSHEDHVQDVKSASAVKKLNQSPVEDKTFKVDAKIFTTKQKLSTRTDELPGCKPTHSKQKVVLDACSELINADVGIKFPVNQTEPWTILAHKKPQKGWIAYNPRTMRPPPLREDTKSVKLVSWNVNGLRALLKLEGFSALELAQRENFDVLCLQETKLQEKDVEKIKQCLIDGYENSFWTCSVSKLGYSGTAIVSRIKPLSVRYGLGISDHDSEGRLVTVEFDSFYLICAYVPNSGDGLKRLSYRVEQWDLSLSSYLKELEKSKPVILTGDLNCAHQEIDIYNPAGNKRSAGFTDEERQSFERNFLSKGFVDTFRKQHPGILGYTYWGYRHGGRKTNKGWRLDYFLVSESIADKVHDSYIIPDVTGSDHSPIGLVLKL